MLVLCVAGELARQNSTRPRKGCIFVLFICFYLDAITFSRARFWWGFCPGIFLFFHLMAICQGKG